MCVGTMEKLRATVVIWGNDNYNVLGLLRQLTPFVENVLFLVNSKTSHCATKSKYCKKYKVVKTIDEGIRFLIKYGSQNIGPKFIISSSDLLAQALDLHQYDLSQYYILCTTKEKGRLSKALDKTYQYELARQVGILVPDSRIFKYDTPVEGIRYPCLIKPAFKEKDATHPFKTKICRDENQLKATQKQLLTQGTYVLQQYIIKEKDLLVYGCRFNDGEVVYAGSFTKYRWAGGDGSYGTISREIPTCIDLDKLNTFLERIDYLGLFSAEFGIEDDKAWFYEFNLRNDGTSHYFYQANIANLPLAWIRYHINGGIKPSVNNNTAIFIDEIGDYKNVGYGVVSMSEWERQRRSASVFKIYDAHDRLPYYCVKLEKYLSRLYHKIKRRNK